MKLTPKGKKLLVCTIVFALLMFAWIPVAVLLTGGRDFGEFTQADREIMAVFAGVETMTVALTFIFAYFTGKENLAYKPQMPKPPATLSEKAIRRRGFLLQLLAFVLALGCCVGGILTRRMGGESWQTVCRILQWCFVAVAVALPAGGFILHRRHKTQLERMQVSQMQEMILSHRIDPEKTTAQKLKELEKWRTVAALYSVLLGILGAGVAFCSGAAGENNVTPTLFGAVVIMGGFSRIRMGVPQSVFQEDKTFITAQQYPGLFALARKAADTVGCGEKIHISLQPDARAGISKINEGYILYLGVILLQMYTEEELYTILLHEFTHVQKEYDADQRQMQYANWLQNGKLPHYTSGISELLFRYPDWAYSFQFMFYRYAVALGVETAADQAMVRWGDPEVAASSLLKLKYYELFEWEDGGRDERNLYVEPEPEATVLHNRIDDFHREMAERWEDWNRLMKAEILARSASHPTVKMRLEQFGVTEAKALPVEPESDYYQETRRALEYMEELLRENRLESYEEKRAYFYLKPLERVEQWEAAGKPLVAEEYADVVWSLRTLERTEDALELLERAIAELPPAASCFAYFTRGLCRLYRYDPAGLEDLYFAVENNSNYIDKALSVIGQFCCLTGNQEELDQYRQKAVQIGQKDKDVYSQLGQLKRSDNLSPEHLPEGMQEALLDYIAAADTGKIVEQVYLVRKTITEDFFTSAVVIRFRELAPEDQQEELMHKVFSYLDTSSDWQFSLFDYRDVKQVKLDRIENSCIYQRKIKL